MSLLYSNKIPLGDSRKNEKKHRNREYLPNWVIYIPLYTWYLFQSIRFQSFGWVVASNPGITHGGLIGDGKQETLSQFEKTYIPKTIYWEDNNYTESVRIQQLQDASISLPCIVKANTSWRSQKVKIISCRQDMEMILQQHWGKLVIQELITKKEEYGITYGRLPGSDQGVIIGLMKREFAVITGDGVHTLGEIIQVHPRYHRYGTILKEENESKRDSILKLGETVTIMPYGAHSRGTIFRDISSKVTQKLTDAIDKAAKQIVGFYVGRFDIKADSLEDIEQGNFIILELNGVGGMPAHMFDPAYSRRKGQKKLFQYWNFVVKVIKNHIYHNTYVPYSLHKMLKIITLKI